MTTENETLLNTVYKTFLGENSMAVKLREGRGITLFEYELLVDSIEKLIVIYQTKNHVPKKLASCFMDITNIFYSCQDLYEEDEFNILADMAFNLHFLGERLFEESV